jgi:hypothetical protein
VVSGPCRDAGGELADRLAQIVLRQIGSRRDFETGIAQQLRHGLGVIAGLGSGTTAR